MKDNRLKRLNRYIDLMFLITVAVSAAYQIIIWNTHRMHMDETLYSYWALRIADGSDIFLHHTTTDKFPLLPYMIAIVVSVFGNSETTVRIPSFLCTIGGFFILYKAVTNFYDKKTALFAVIITALTKYFIVYGPTAFTDQIMTFFVLASFLMITEKKYFLSGILIGISAMAKLTGLFFYLPFFIGIFMLSDNRKKDLTDFSFGVFWMLLAIIMWAGLVELNAFRLFMANSPIPYKGTLDTEYFINGFNTIKKYQADLMGLPQFFTALIAGLILIFIKGNGYIKKDITVYLTFVLFYMTLAAMTFRHVPIFERYLVVIVPFTAIVIARGVSVIFEIVNKLHIIPAVISAAAVFSFVLLPLDRKMNIGALYDVNDGIEKAVGSIPDKENSVAINLGIQHCVALYYYYDFALNAGHIDGINREKHIIRDITMAVEGRKKYIISTAEGAKVVDTEIKQINGLYYNHKPVLYKVIEHNNQPKYFVYEIIKTTPIKNEFLINRDSMKPMIPLNVEYNNFMKLSGISWKKIKDNKVEFIYYWEKTGKTEKNWRVDVHFLDEFNSEIHNGDHYAAHALAQFNKINIGDIVEDRDIVEFNEWNKVKSINIGLHQDKYGKKAKVKGKNQHKISI